MAVVYNFPESEVIGEALYGAVLVNKNNSTARYHTLEAGSDESGHFCLRSLNNHQHVADIATRDRSGNQITHKYKLSAAGCSVAESFAFIVTKKGSLS